MKVASGQTLRLVGLLIEVPCVLGLFSLKRGKLGNWDASAIDPALLLSIGIGLGFFCWITGTVIIHWPRDQPRPPGRHRI